MQRDDATDILHYNLSKAVNAVAIFPPVREGDGLGLLDIVVVRPSGGKDEMLVATGANIGDVLSWQDKNMVERQFHSTTPAIVPKSVSAAGLLHADISDAMQTSLDRVGFLGGLDGKGATDLIILGEARKFIRGKLSIIVERMVASNFPKLLAHTSLSHHARRNFLFGVITSVITGELAATTAMSCSGKAATEDLAEGIGERAQVQATASNKIKICGCGVIGVRMLCFSVKLDGRARTYQLSAPIAVVQPNDDYLQAARLVARGRDGGISAIEMDCVRRNLFEGTQMIKPGDVDEETRDAYIEVLETQGSRRQDPSF
jgi:hypothetical protein